MLSGLPAGWLWTRTRGVLSEVRGEHADGCRLADCSKTPSAKGAEIFVNSSVREAFWDAPQGAARNPVNSGLLGDEPRRVSETSAADRLRPSGAHCWRGCRPAHSQPNAQAVLTKR